MPVPVEDWLYLPMFLLILKNNNTIVVLSVIEKQFGKINHSIWF